MQALLQLPHHRVQVAKDPVGKLLLAQFVPNVFLRIEFGRIRRQGQQSDVVGDLVASIPVSLLADSWSCSGEGRGRDGGDVLRNVLEDIKG